MSGNNSIRKFFTSKSFVRGGISIIIIVIVLAISIFGVLISDMLFENKKLDLTKERLYELGKTTKEVLDGLENEVEIYNLADLSLIANTTNFSALQIAFDLLDSYAEYSDKVKVMTIDPDREPQIIAQLDPSGALSITKYMLVFKCGDSVRPFQLGLNGTDFLDDDSNLIAEQIFTEFIKTVSKGINKKVYYTLGHGEPDLQDERSDYHEYLYTGLYRLGYDLEAMNVASKSEIPADASFLLIISPKNDLSNDDAYKIDHYMKQGGNAVILFDPVVPDILLNNFNSVLNKYNIGVKNTFIRETDKNNFRPEKPDELILDLKGGPLYDTAGSYITKAVFSKCTQLDMLKNEKEGLESYRWFWTGGKALSSSISNPEDSKEGEFSIIITSEYTLSGTTSKVFTSATSAFLSDSFINSESGNSETSGLILQSAMYWLGETSEEVSVPAKTGLGENFALTAGEAQISYWVLLLIIPLGLISAGVAIWLIRRHK